MPPAAPRVMPRTSVPYGVVSERSAAHMPAKQKIPAMSSSLARLGSRARSLRTAHGEENGSAWSVSVFSRRSAVGWRRPRKR